MCTRAPRWRSQTMLPAYSPKRKPGVGSSCRTRIRRGASTWARWGLLIVIGYTLGSRAGREAPLAQQLAEPRAPRVAHPESPRPRPPPPSPPSGVRCDVSEPSLCLAMDVDALRLENEMMTRANTDTCRRKIKDTAQFLRHGFRRHFPRHEFAERSCPVRRPPRTTPQRQPRLAATASSLHRVAIIGHGHWLRWEHPPRASQAFVGSLGD